LCARIQWQVNALWMRDGNGLLIWRKEEEK
jgi:hypothetical protein